MYYDWLGLQVEDNDGVLRTKAKCSVEIEINGDKVELQLNYPELRVLKCSEKV